jgi:hypothetical protein
LHAHAKQTPPFIPEAPFISSLAENVSISYSNISPSANERNLLSALTHFQFSKRVLHIALFALAKRAAYQLHAFLFHSAI